MKKFTKKILSFVLVLCMIYASGASMLLSTATENTSDAITDAAYALTDSYDTTAVQADKPYTLDLTTVPEIVGTDTAVDAGHVQRLYEQEEDLYSVVFRNDDGTKTAYYYNHPVKYVDTDGSIKDISDLVYYRITE